MGKDLDESFDADWITEEETELIGRICSEILNREKPFFERPSRKTGLWHYTNIDAAMKIIQGQSIRLGNAQYMNDKNEFSSSRDIIQSSIHKFGSQEFHSIYRMLHSAEEPNGIDLNACAKETYIASFTTNKDKLSQWRGYANSSNGIAIKFQVPALFKAIKRHWRFDFSKVIYANKKKIELIKRFTHKIDELFASIDHADAEFDDATVNVEIFLSRCVASFKDYSWAEEDEYRIIAISDDEEYRPSYELYHGDIRPYLYLPISPKSAITEIMLLDHDERRKESLENFLKFAGMSNTQVTFSALNMRF